MTGRDILSCWLVATIYFLISDLVFIAAVQETVYRTKSTCRSFRPDLRETCMCCYHRYGLVVCNLDLTLLSAAKDDGARGIVVEHVGVDHSANGACCRCNMAYQRRAWHGGWYRRVVKAKATTARVTHNRHRHDEQHIARSAAKTPR